LIFLTSKYNYVCSKIIQINSTTITYIHINYSNKKKINKKLRNFKSLPQMNHVGTVTVKVLGAGLGGSTVVKEKDEKKTTKKNLELKWRRRTKR